jgi:hypothetical protein
MPIKPDTSNRPSARNHIASYAVMDRTGKRLGTHYVHRPEQVASVLKAKHFKWASSQARRDWLAWFKRHRGES